MSSCQPQSVAELGDTMTREQFIALENELMTAKIKILNTVLEIMPANLKARAKCICDNLINNNRIWLNKKHELIIDGDVVPGSNICTKIIELLAVNPSSGENVMPTTHCNISTMTKSRIAPRMTAEEPPAADTFQFTQLEKENERLKRILAYYEKALAKAKGISDSESGTEDEDSDGEDGIEDEDSEDVTDDGEDETEDEEDEDEEEYTTEDEEEEPYHSNAKKKKY